MYDVTTVVRCVYQRGAGGDDDDVVVLRRVSPRGLGRTKWSVWSAQFSLRGKKKRDRDVAVNPEYGERTWLQDKTVNK